MGPKGPVVSGCQVFVKYLEVLVMQLVDGLYCLRRHTLCIKVYLIYWVVCHVRGRINNGRYSIFLCEGGRWANLNCFYIFTSDDWCGGGVFDGDLSLVDCAQLGCGPS